MPRRYSQLLQIRQAYWDHPERALSDQVRQERALYQQINFKDTATAFAKAAGIKTVEQFKFDTAGQAMAKAFELDWPRFVIKPLRGFSSSGVLSRGGVYCHMTQQRIDDVRDFAARLDARSPPGQNGKTSPFLLESCVIDSLGFPIPLDYKVHAFKTGCPVVMQRDGPATVDPKDWAVQFYDRAGNALPPIHKLRTGRPDASLPQPPNLEEIFSAAEVLIGAMSVSFMRIDLYSSVDGVVFGEFTPAPIAGRDRFVDEYETILGAHWEESLEVLGLTYEMPFRSQLELAGRRAREQADRQVRRVRRGLKRLHAAV